MIHLLTSRLFIFSAFITIANVRGQNLEVNNKCNYYFNRRIFNCDGLQNVANVADTLGPFITNRTNVLILKNSKKAIFHANQHTQQNYVNLISYKILDSEYLSVEPGSFKGLVNVYDMELRKNIWNTIETDTFVGLRNLESLYLTNNQIQTLNTGCFNDLKKLRILDLSNNSLQTLPSYVFQDLTELENLFINNNLISVIQENAFVGLNSLKLLILSKNSLEYVDANEFNKLENANDITVSFNKVRSIRGQFSLRELEFLRMSDNELRELNEDVFKDCPEIRSVDLSRNKLRYLTQKPFLVLNKLQYLNLQGNSLTREKFPGLNAYLTI